MNTKRYIACVTCASLVLSVGAQPLAYADESAANTDTSASTPDAKPVVRSLSTTDTENSAALSSASASDASGAADENAATAGDSELKTEEVSDPAIDDAKQKRDEAAAQAAEAGIIIDDMHSGLTTTDDQLNAVKDGIVDDYDKQTSELSDVDGILNKHRAEYLKEIKDSLNGIIGSAAGKDTTGTAQLPWNLSSVLKMVGFSDEVANAIEKDPESLTDEQLNQVYQRLKGLTLISSATSDEAHPQTVVVTNRDNTTDFTRMELNNPFTYRNIFKNSATGKYIDVRITPIRFMRANNYKTITGDEAWVALSDNDESTAIEDVRRANPLNNISLFYTVKGRNVDVFGKRAPHIVYQVEFLDADTNTQLIEKNQNINTSDQVKKVAINPLLLFTDIDARQGIKLMSISDTEGNTKSFVDLLSADQSRDDIVLLGSRADGKQELVWYAGPNAAKTNTDYFTVSSNTSATENNDRGAWLLASPNTPITGFTYAFFNWNSNTFQSGSGLGLTADVREAEGDHVLPVDEVHYSTRTYTLYREYRETAEPEPEPEPSNPATEETPVIDETPATEETPAADETPTTPDDSDVEEPNPEVDNTEDENSNSGAVTPAAQERRAETLPDTSDTVSGAPFALAGLMGIFSAAGALLFARRNQVRND